MYKNTPAHKQARRNPFRAPFTIGSARVTALRAFIRHTFGATLPDDDYGRMVLRPLLDHIAFNGGDAEFLRQVCLDLLPELDDDDSLDILIKEVGPGRKWQADALAREIGLDFETRTRLGICTIGSFDVSKDRRKAIYAQKRAADKRWAREKRGANPQAKSARRRQPWEAEGISKRTYYYRRKQAAAAHKARDDATHKISGLHHFGPHTLSISQAVSTAGPATPPLPNQKQAAWQRDDLARVVPEIDPAVAAFTKKQDLLSFEAATSQSVSSTARAATPISEQKEKAARAAFFGRRREWERDRDAARWLIAGMRAVQRRRGGSCDRRSAAARSRPPACGID